MSRPIVHCRPAIPPRDGSDPVADRTVLDPRGLRGLFPLRQRPSDVLLKRAMPLAKFGDPIPGPGDDHADTTLYTAPSGAIAFDTGTLGWELGLEPVPSASPDAPLAPDPRVVAMTRNLLAHVLSGSHP